MATLTTLHLKVEDGAQEGVRQERNGIVHISIPPIDHHPHHSNIALNINNLRISLSKLQNHWKIEGTLTVSMSVLFQHISVTLIQLIDIELKIGLKNYGFIGFSFLILGRCCSS